MAARLAILAALGLVHWGLVVAHPLELTALAGGVLETALASVLVVATQVHTPMVAASGAS